MALKFTIVLLVALSAAWAADEGYDNSYDSKLSYECHPGRVLRSVHSIFSNAKGDREWEFSCSRPVSDADPKQDCHWTSDYVNEWGKPVFFVCPADHAMAGIQSIHNNDSEDRRSKFYCCKDPNYKTGSCYLTGYLNDFKEALQYTRENGEVITGWFSEFHARDRRHKFLVCSYNSQV